MPSFYSYKDSFGNTNLFDDNFIPADSFRIGNLWTWGTGSGGLLGINSTLTKRTPVTIVNTGPNWTKISNDAIWSAVLGIRTDGSLWAWGANSAGLLGVNDTFTRSTPSLVFGGGNNWKDVSSSSTNCAAIKTDGSLWVWGDNSLGQLVSNDNIYRSTPITTFIGGNNWKQVSCGNNIFAAIKTDGSLWTWGDNFSGQLGINDTAGRSTPVTTFIGGNNWKQVSCGVNYISAIKTDGSLWVWGNNNIGQLGINAITNRSTPVTTFIGGNNWKQVSCGLDNVGAIKTNGSLWIWGGNSQGKLGTNDSIIRSTPVTTFIGGNNWKQVSCGSSHTAAIKTDGSLWAWGANFDGQLGINNNIARITPITTINGGNNWKEVRAGNLLTVALTYADDII